MDDHTEARQEPTRSPEPGTDKLVLYEGQRRALAEIMAGMDADAKWVLLLGPEGIGKSSILKRLLTELRLTDADTVLCDGVKASEADGLATALRGQLRLPEPTRRRLGPAYVGDDIIASRRLTRRPLAVLVDNAQELSATSLSLLGDLAAARSAEHAGVCVVLAGTPFLEETALRVGNQVKQLRCRIAGLTATEVRQYVERRLSATTETLPEFSDDAIPQIARSTNGIPGSINTLLEVVVRRPAARLTNHVSADSVVEAARQLGLDRSLEDVLVPDIGDEMVEPEPEVEERESEAERSARRRRRVRALALWMATGMLTGLIIYIAPPLVHATREWLSTLSAPPPAPTAKSAPSAPGGPRREAGSGAASARGSRRVSEATASRTASEPRSGGSAESTPAPPRPAPPSPQQIAAVIAEARDGRTDELKQLLASGVPANVRDASGITPLMQAVLNGHTPAAGVLLDRGAEINARDRGGITPVMQAVINEHEDALQLLLARGADVNARSGTGWTALTFAAWKGDPDLVRLLLRYGANPRVVDKQGWSPLDYATAQLRSSTRDAVELPMGLDLPAVSAEARHAEVIPLLLQGGASR